MEGPAWGCFNCGIALSETLGNFAPCDVCGERQLCLVCSCTGDIAICKFCSEEQSVQTKQQEDVFAKHKKCVQCSAIWRVERCQTCSKDLCYKCGSDQTIHPCVACVNCDAFGPHECCGSRWCPKCFEGYHATTNCAERLFYQCPYCSNKIKQFGPDILRCAVEDCKWKYACHHPSCTHVRAANGRTFCQFHVSGTRCPGCDAFYGLNGMQGRVWLFKLLPKNPFFRGRSIYYCGNCREKLRAFVQSIFLLTKRFHLVIPAEIMEMLIFTFLQETLPGPQRLAFR